MKNLVLWDGGDLGCLAIGGIGCAVIIVGASVSAFLSFIFQPAVGIPLTVALAILAAVGYTLDAKEKRASRTVINEFGTPEQKERLAAGYMKVTEEAKKILSPIAFAPLLQSGFEHCPDDTPVQSFDKTTATDDDYKMLKEVRTLFPQADVDLIRVGLMSREQTGVEVSGTWYNLPLTGKFQRSKPTKLP